MTALKTKKQFRPGFESLEDRSLMAGGITASFSQGLLSVYGSDYGDRIAVRQIGSKVTVDGFSGSVSASLIKGIKVDGRYGDDAITIALSKALASKTMVLGGYGIDSLVAPLSALPTYRATLERYLDSGKMTSERGKVDAAFAGIRGEFEVMSGSTTKFNCIAWSLGITSQWINPQTTWAGCDKLNAQFGYKRMSTLDFSRVSGYEKIVLYGKVNSLGQITSFTHQARQLKDGTWTSKLGGLAMIRHVTPDTLDGAAYGVPVAVYYRYNPAFA